MEPKDCLLLSTYLQPFCRFSPEKIPEESDISPTFNDSKKIFATVICSPLRLFLLLLYGSRYMIIPVLFTLRYKSLQALPPTKNFSPANRLLTPKLTHLEVTNMKKMIALCALAAMLMSSTAMAAPKENQSNNGNHGQAKTQIEASATVTGSTYGEDSGEDEGPRVPKGLERAYENVKDKPAGRVIADLLKTKYNVDVEAEVVLEEAAAELEAQGEIEAAVDVQKEAVKASMKDLKVYKKLGKLLEKAGKAGVKLYVNGEEPSFEVAPFIKEGSTLVPFRAIAESLKAEVTWNPDERSVTVSRDGITVKLFIGDTTAFVNGQEVTLEVAGEIYNGSTMVPVRFISESLKADVQWEPETQSVVIVEEGIVEAEADQQ
jgi:phosphoglycolate phosphatase-like HAD superfamily hydrolase